MHILLSAGSNARGQLANASEDDSHRFEHCSFFGCGGKTLPPEIHNIIDIASGANHTLLLAEVHNGHTSHVRRRLWGCGDGTAGQLGPAYQQDVHSSNIFRPLNLGIEQKYTGYQYKLISAAWETSFIVLSSAHAPDVVLSMGADTFGDLGVGGKRKGDFSISRITFSHLRLGNAIIDEKTIIVQSITCGPHHIIIQLKAGWSDGSYSSVLAGWGASRHGQLGHITNERTHSPPFVPSPQIVAVEDAKDLIVSVALGHQHTIILHSSGKIRAFGSNRKGQLQGLNAVVNARTAACTWYGSYLGIGGDNGDSQILATGSHNHGQLGCAIPVRSDRVYGWVPVELPFSFARAEQCSITCGTEHVLLLRSRNTVCGWEVWGWGWNEHGNLGTGSTTDILMPIKLWPADQDGNGGCRSVRIWAGPGTSWIYASFDDEEGQENEQ